MRSQPCHDGLTPRCKRSRRAAAPGRHRQRPGVELLEDRAVPAVLSTFLTTEHVDGFNLGYSGGTDGVWSIRPRNSDEVPAVSYAADEALLYVGKPALTPRLASSAFDFIGVPASADFYQLPQSQDPNLLFLGGRASGGAGDVLNPADFDRYDPAAESKDRVSGLGAWLKVSLVSVQHFQPNGQPGDGAFSVWQSEDTGPNVFMASYDDGVANPNGSGLDTTDGVTADDAVWIIGGGHIHFNWGFTQKGRYEITVKASGYLDDGNTTSLGQFTESQPITLYFSVGSVGQLEFDAASYSVNESAGTASVKVRRVGGSDGRITVNFASTAGSATLGDDFTDASATLTFNDQETEKTITIPIVNNSVIEPDETVNLALSNPGPSSIAGYVTSPSGDNSSLLGGQATAVLTIVDNDSANLPPTISAIADTTSDEDVAKLVAFTIGDDETPAQNLVVTATSSNTVLAPNANLTLGGSGANRTLTVTPAANQSGMTTITITVKDAANAQTTETFDITFNPVNDAPAANAQSVSATEDTPKAITLTGTDLEGSDLTYTVVTGPTHGTLSGTAPNLTYTPDPNYAGGDTFTFKVNDGALDSSVATVTITVSAVNDAPSANAQSVSTAEDMPKAIILTGMDIDSAGLSYLIVTPPMHGTLSGTAPNLTYTPDPHYHGADDFAFKVNDGALDSDPATVSITISPVNDVPTTVADAYVLGADSSLFGNVLFNDSDIDGDVITAALASGPAHGTVALAADGSFTYAPGPSFAGSDTFAYQASDGNLTSAAVTVTIAAATPQDFEAVITVGHTDIGIAYEDGWDLHVHDEENDAEYEPDAALLYVGPQAETIRLPGAAFDFIGVGAGEAFWQLPHSPPHPELLLLGFGAEEIAGGVFQDGLVRLQLKAVNGPGHFSVWRSTDLGPEVFMATSDGITAADLFTGLTGGHEDMNFGFTARGRYEVTFQAWGFLDDGDQIADFSADVTYFFSVDNLGRLQFDAATYTVAEGDVVTVTVERVGGSDGPLTVDFAAVGGSATSGSDYAAVGGTLTFADGETVQSFQIAALTDVPTEANETVSLALTVPAESAAVLGNPAVAEATIADAPGLRVTSFVAKRASGHLSSLRIRFNDAANLRTLIKTGKIRGAVQLMGPRGRVALAASDFRYKAGTRTLTVNLNDSTRLPHGRYELRLKTQRILGTSGGRLVDHDGTLDGVLRYRFRG